MSKRIFTKQQIKELLKNKQITNCSDKAITYSKTFKVEAVKLCVQGLTSTEIFTQAGFDLNVIGRKQPNECLQRWNKIVRKKGIQGLSERRGKNSKSGGKPKIRDLTDTDKIERLEAEVAYLKAENDFLAKLRAKRME